MVIKFVVTGPPAGARKGLSYGPRVHLPSKENAWSRHQRLFEKNVGKTKRRWSVILKWGVRELFLHTGKVLAPHASVTRDDSLQSSVQIWLKNYVFSLFMFLCFSPLYFFFIFLAFFMFFNFCVFYVFVFCVVDKGFSLAPTYPRVRWGNQTYVVL